MNTERPENDDAAREPDEPERVGRPDSEPGTGSLSGTTGAGSLSGTPGSGEGSGEGGAGVDAGAEEETGAAGTAGEKPSASADAEDKAGADAKAEADTEAGASAEPEAAVETEAVEKGEAADEAEAAETPRTVEKPEAAAGTGVAGKPEATDEADGTRDSGITRDAEVAGVAPAHGPSPSSRRRSPLLVASVAAAVLLVGGGGALLSAQAGGGSGSGAGAPSGDGTPPVLALDDLAGGAPGGGTTGIAPGEPNPYGVVYRADGDLPDGPGTAPVYWAADAVGKDEVTRLAKALGVTGTPVTDGDAWRVGSGADGSGPVLRVNRQAPNSWTFTRYTPGSDNCTRGIARCTKDPAAPAADPVGEAAAKKAAAPVLKAVGQDDAALDASQVMGAQRIVNADPVFDGLPSHGWTTGVTVSAQGAVVGANGQLGTPVKGETYPLLSAEEALEAMNAGPGTGQRTDIGGCASPVPLEDGTDSACGSAAGTAQKETVTVEDAVLGLAPHTSGGRQVLVPSWLFGVKGTGAADGYTLTHPAVEPAYLTSASTPEPAPTATGSPRDVPVSGYTAEGDELVVSFTGGVCGDYAATADESGGEVKVTVTETPWPDKVCILIAKEYRLTVRLDEPLGGRKVVGSDGAAIPLEKPGARLPR